MSPTYPGAATAQVAGGFQLADILSSFDNKVRLLKALAAITLESATYVPDAALPMSPDVACGVAELVKEWDALSDAIEELARPRGRREEDDG